MIKIPKKLFTPNTKYGLKPSAIVYALDRNTIGVTPDLESDWGDNCLYLERVSCKSSGDNWRVSLPSLVKRFYLLSELRTIVSLNGGRVIITVTR